MRDVTESARLMRVARSRSGSVNYVSDVDAQEPSGADSSGGLAQPVDTGLDPWVGPDQALQILTDLANNAGLRLPVRLFVSAGVLSGELVGGREFFEGLRGSIDTGSDEDVHRAMDNLFNFLAQPYDDRAVEEESVTNRLTVYIHLRGAWLYAAGQPPIEVGSWRGRLTSVDGWALGSYSTQA